VHIKKIRAPEARSAARKARSADTARHSGRHSESAGHAGGAAVVRADAGRRRRAECGRLQAAALRVRAAESSLSPPSPVALFKATGDVIAARPRASASRLQADGGDRLHWGSRRIRVGRRRESEPEMAAGSLKHPA
jgi:hypothetical protein